VTVGVWVGNFDRTPLVGSSGVTGAGPLFHAVMLAAEHRVAGRFPSGGERILELPAGLVGRVSVIRLPANGRSLAARALRNAARLARGVPPLVDRFSGFEHLVEEAVRGRRYDIGIVEHSWCAPYWGQVSRACDRTVLDLHNIESVLHARSGSTEPGATAFAHRIFRQASLEMEREWLPRYSQVLAPSENDAELARTIAPRANVSVYPNAIPLTALPPQGNENTVVFSGNMEYHPNYSAVRFFRREIWPALRAEWPGLVWRLIGKNPQAVRQFTTGDSRIEVQGQVDDAVRELARGRVAVVPLLAGSGTRLKVLEAWAAGLAVVSTGIGAEGLPVRDEENILLAEGAAAFTRAVSRLLACSDLRTKLGMAGRSLLEKEFTWEMAWLKLNF